MKLTNYDLDIEPLKFACDGYTEQFTEDIGIAYLRLLTKITKEHMIDIFEIKGNFNALNPTVKHTVLCSLLTKYLYKEFPEEDDINNFLKFYKSLEMEDGSSKKDIQTIIDIYNDIRKEVFKDDVLKEIARRIKL